MSDLRAELVITGVDKASGPISRVNRSLSRLSRASLSLRTFGSNLAGLGASVASITGVAGALAGLGAAVSGIGLARGVIETSSQFEAYGVQLKALEGSAEKARIALSWTQDFAKRTPLELSQVVEAYAQLRTFGIDPTNGTLQALVDTMAKSGKGAEQLDGIILAVGQAWTKQKLQGEEAMQLLERGVPVWDLLAKATGKSVVELQKLSSAGKLGRDVIKLLIDEMGKSSVGASDEFAKTFDGITSMISDNFTNIRRMVGEAGVFDAVKNILVDLNNELDRMSNDGSLKEIATEIGGGLASGINEAVAGFKELINVMGGSKEAVKSIGEIFVFTGKVIGEISRDVAALVKIFDRLTKAIPSLKSFASMPTLEGPLFNVERGGVADRAMKWLGIGDNSVAARERNKVTGEVVGSPEDAAARNRMDEARRGALVNGTRGRSATSAAAAASKAPVEVGGKVQIEVTAKDGAAARVTGVSSTNRSAPISVDQGLVLAGP